MFRPGRIVRRWRHWQYLEKESAFLAENISSLPNALAEYLKGYAIDAGGGETPVEVFVASDQGHEIIAGADSVTGVDADVVLARTHSLPCHEITRPNKLL